MAAVKQQVLNWLYSVLTSEYKDVNRTYNDVAQTLAYYSSLSPRTEVYTFEHGAFALLLHLSGTLPVTFRGTTYRFPISVWVPHEYPREAPIVYVTPTEGMVVRPGQHIDPQGKVYHPYLVRWSEYWDKSNILDFLAILREIFAKEPPVIARQQQHAPLRPRVEATPPPIPPLPPGRHRPDSTSSTLYQEPPSQAPPPPPPKPTSAAQSYSSTVLPRRDNGPPLPPTPNQQGYRHNQYAIQSSSRPQNGQPHDPQRSSSLRYETAPPLPPQQHQQFQEPSYIPSPVSSLSSPDVSHSHLTYNHQQQYQHSQNTPPSQQPPRQNTQPSFSQPPQQPQYANQPPQWQQYPPQQNQQPQHKAAPPPDLLDAPLTLPIPSSASTNLPAPPVPPNPEKDMLLHNIGRALQAQRQHTSSQTSSSLPGLQSQHKAMVTVLTNMEAEIHALESLSNLLVSNTDILHNALRDADAMINSSQHRTAPNIDEILVAPTVVGNQLYELVCEERSLGDALFVLGRAVERGRIAPAVFAKMTRTLAREWYLKKALVKKIGKGMGLSSY